jgi:uncharacterized membrane protein
MNRPDPTPQQQVREEHRAEMRLNTVISRVLIIGLLAAVALLVVGAILTFARPGVAVVHATSVGSLPSELGALQPGGFLQLGLLVLLLTPFARVVALGIAFGRRRQWLFTTISVVVAALLILGAALGLSLG